MVPADILSYLLTAIGGGSVSGAVLWWALRYKLEEIFVTREDFNGATRRMDIVEKSYLSLHDKVGRNERDLQVMHDYGSKPTRELQKNLAEIQRDIALILQRINIGKI